MSPPTRRAFVGGASLTLLPLVGCLSGSPSGTQPSETTETARCQVAKSTLGAEPVQPSPEQQKHIVPVKFEEQTDTVREVFARVADGESLTGACPTGTPTTETERALDDVIGIVQDTLSEQRDRYDGDPPEWIRDTAYLRRDGECYALSARLSDVGVSYPTDLPSDSTVTASSPNP